MQVLKLIPVHGKLIEINILESHVILIYLFHKVFIAIAIFLAKFDLIIFIFMLKAYVELQFCANPSAL